jgi:preprotein translocase subunit SecF
MSLMNKIENLQKKPEAIRRRILVVSIVAVMFLVVVIWIFSLNFSLGSDEKNETSFTPFKIVGGLVGDVYDAFDNLWSQFQKTK